MYGEKSSAHMTWNNFSLVRNYDFLLQSRALSTFEKEEREKLSDSTPISTFCSIQFLILKLRLRPSLTPGGQGISLFSSVYSPKFLTASYTIPVMMQGCAWGNWLLIEGLARKKSSKLLLLFFQFLFFRNTDNFSFKMHQTNAWNADFILLLCFPFYGIRVYVNYIYKREEYVAWSKIADSTLARANKDFAPSLQIDDDIQYASRL